MLIKAHDPANIERAKAEIVERAKYAPDAVRTLKDPAGTRSCFFGLYFLLTLTDTT